MYPLNNKNKLLDLLEQGATVITPNNRLSAALLQHYFSSSQNKTVDKPSCLPYRNLLINCFEELKYKNPEQSHPILLNEAQCQHLWRTIIKSDPAITYSEGLLQTLMEAWTHCQQWHISSENPAFCYTPQTKQFQQWWSLFENTLKKINAINEHQLIPYLLKTDDTLFINPVIWVCFDDFNPQQISLQNYLTQNNIIQYCYDLQEQNNTTKVLTAKNKNEEYQQLMAWLHLKIQEKNQRIGVVIPNLEQESRFLQRILLEHFEAEQFDISLGKPLSEFPLIAHALTWLNLDHHNVNTHQASLILQSPYLGSAKEEFIGRSQYLQDSTLIQGKSFSLKALAQDVLHHAPKLSDLLNKITPFPKNASVHEWIQIIQDYLNTLEFPGNYGLNSENYQCFNRFTALFDEMRQLSIISTSMSKHEAIDALIRIAQNTIFQAQKTTAPIQVSGLLEASGCEFDSLWIMGLTDQCLPKKAHLSAFIPPQLQRELLMPHSLPSRELHFAKQTLSRLMRGSSCTVFSYSRLVGDTPNLPSSLIMGLPDFKLLPIENDALKQNCFVILEEDYTVPLIPEERISGGTSILSHQAKCPFKAFAQHRLKAAPSQPTSEGLDQNKKGIITHKIMELFWKSIGSQQELLRLKPEELEQHIAKAIESTLQPLKENQLYSFSDLILEVERARLYRLVFTCLALEKQRPPFTIAAIEESYTIHLAGLDFTVRVDRLDQVADRKWVIDYKSTIPGSMPWNEEKPTEPQLLLYALLDQDIDTLLFMQLKTGQVKYKGFSAQKQEVSGISNLKESELWELHRNEWHQQLSLLAEEIQIGICTPQPANATICQNCDFQNLCRFQMRP